MSKIIVKDKKINIKQINTDDYISLTDIARIKNVKEPKDMVMSCMRLE